MMKKALLVILMMIFAFSLVFAGPSAQQKNSSGKLRIAFIPQLIGIPYFTAMEEGGKKAAQDLGVEFIYTGSTQANAQEQVKLMDSLIRQKVDAISLSTLDSSSTNPYIERAQAQGIQVYTSDSDAPDSTRSFYVAQALDDELGYTLMDRLAAQIGASGQIGIVSGESTATNLNAWIGYMQDRQKEKYPNIQIVDIRYTQGGSSESALRQAQELMTRFPNIKGLVAVASSTIPGVAQAVQQEGKAGKIAVIGYGSPATVKPYMVAGVMKESILWNAWELGYLTVWAGKIACEGKSFDVVNNVAGLSNAVRYFADKKILLLGEPLVITIDNVNKFDF